MKISFDPAKRNQVLADRGIDFTDAIELFEGKTLNFPDERCDYGEVRMITLGYLRSRMMVVVWTPRGALRHIISMRKANEREKTRFEQRLGED